MNTFTRQRPLGWGSMCGPFNLLFVPWRGRSIPENPGQQEAVQLAFPDESVRAFAHELILDGEIIESRQDHNSMVAGQSRHFPVGLDPMVIRQR